MQGNGNAADRRVVGSRNGQAVNVEAAAAEQAGHARQNTVMVIYQQTDDPPGCRCCGNFVRILILA